LLTGYRLRPNGQYSRIQPDTQGRLLSETTGLLFGVGSDGQTLTILDTRTGEWLVDSGDLARREAEARKAAEDLAAREAEARRAAEAELAKLRAELEKVRKAGR
jgi:hypothetical protein